MKMAALRSAQKLALAVPVASATMTYLLVLDLANRERITPPFWGAVDVQAQFLGLGISYLKSPETWVFKYGMWSWLFVIEFVQGHASVLLVLLQALLAFSFVMDVGVNRDYHGRWYCCSSYSTFFFCAAGQVAAMDAALCRKKRRWEVASGVLVGWLVSAVGILVVDSWRPNHHLLAFLLGTVCALLSVASSRTRVEVG